MTSERTLSVSNQNNATTSPSLNRRELTSVYALVAYAAFHRNISEEIVHKTLAQHFGVTDITQLPSHSYDEVIKFLVDIQVNLLLN